MKQATIELIKGLWKENPTFRMLIGMCAPLAITNMVFNGIMMGLATTFVLVLSGLVVSLIKNIVPHKVRIPVFVVIIATFVTVADYYIAAYYPDTHRVLGLYLPLIVVNCLILARIEAFASKMPVFKSFMDALGMGIGFTLALVIISSVREILGFGTWLGIKAMPASYQPMSIMIQPAGAFITLGLIIALINIISRKKTSGDSA
ncbi:electron transport complex subunit E [Candidatus Woesearchaeota archaeon]|nr:electron transport complex subunit E [Candidatus Woesearchaeota archaeon]